MKKIEKIEQNWKIKKNQKFRKKWKNFNKKTEK